MRWFKTKEEKAKLLEQKLIDLNTKYEGVLHTYCMIGIYVFIFHGFEIRDNEEKQD